MTRFKPKIYISIPERPVDKKLSDIQIELLRCYKIIEQAEKLIETIEIADKQYDDVCDSVLNGAKEFLEILVKE